MGKGNLGQLALFGAPLKQFASTAEIRIHLLQSLPFVIEAGYEACDENSCSRVSTQFGQKSVKERTLVPLFLELQFFGNHFLDRPQSITPREHVPPVL